MTSNLIGHALAAAIGGGLGSLARFAVAAWTLHHYPNLKLPWATLSVNLVGCFIIGLIFGWIPDRALFGLHLRYFIITGLLGGLTTFSAFSIETLLLFRRGEDWSAWVYLFASVAGGLLLAWLGMKISLALSS